MDSILKNPNDSKSSDVNFHYGYHMNFSSAVTCLLLMVSIGQAQEQAPQNQVPQPQQETPKAQQASSGWREDVNVAAKVLSVRASNKASSPLEIVVSARVVNASGEDCFIKEVERVWEIEMDEILVYDGSGGAKEIHVGGSSETYSRDSVYLEGSGEKGVARGSGVVIKEISVEPLARLIDAAGAKEIFNEGGESNFAGSVIVDCYKVSQAKWEKLEARFSVRIRAEKDGEFKILGVEDKK